MPSGFVVGGHFEAFIRAQVESGRYADADEVIRAGLRLLEDQERLRELRVAELERDVREGIESGEGLPADEVFSELKARYVKMGTR